LYTGRENMKIYSFLRVAMALAAVITLSLMIASPALALDLNPADYFQFTFNAVAFDKSEVAPGEVFHITVTGSAACTKDLPLPISEVSITSQVIARPAAGGTAPVLNPTYVIAIKPLPTKAGQTFDINQSVALQFPAGTAPGSYSVVGLLTAAKVKFIVWLDVTGSFPAEQAMGTVKCVVPGATQTAAATTQPSTTAATPSITTTSPTKATAAATTSPTTTLAPTIFEAASPLTFVVIGLFAVIIVLLVIIIVLLRRR
jgi:hypothetical protein